MTVSYSGTVATVSYNSFTLLLLRWRGSVYKAVWPVLALFCGAYIAVALSFHLLPNRTDNDRATRRKFVQICAFAGHISSAIPISFFLGFFVNIVVSRWWQQFLNLPTPDFVCTLLSAYVVRDSDSSSGKPTPREKPLMLRRAVARYMNLSAALCFHSISLSVKRRFPRIDDLVATGLLTDEEVQIYKSISPDKPYFFVPLVWCISLLTRAHHDGLIRHDRHLNALVDAIVAYWRNLHTLFLYDYVNIPLVYNQVVALVVYLYLAILVLSQQFADPAKILKEYDQEVLNWQTACNLTTNTTNLFSGASPSCLMGSMNSSLIGNQTVVNGDNVSLIPALSVSPNIPVFAILTLICYAGWLRVAESHVFPFGDDDDHFETIPLLERNFKASLWFVDHMMQPDQLPPLLRVTDKSETAAPCTVKPDDAANPDSLHYLVPIALNYGAMGLKRSVENPTQLVNRGPVKTPRIAVTTPENEPPIPELPCPAALRRRVSRHFFAGSMTRVYGDDATTVWSPSVSTAPGGTQPSLSVVEPTNLLTRSPSWIESVGVSNTRRPFSSTQELVVAHTPNPPNPEDPSPVQIIRL